MTANSTDALMDCRVNSRMENYTNFWQKDKSKEASVDTENRVENYVDVINGYYDGVTELYEQAWGTSFHFSRFYRGEAFAASLARHEHYLAAQMGLRPGMRVLDVGCGVGGPAIEIARFADVNVVGVNNNDFQLQRARKHANRASLGEGKVEFVKGDFMRLVELFGENTFDAVYAIEATVHAPSWEGVYDQIRRVLKPGGVFGVYEWCMTPRWEPTLPLHKSLAHAIEFGNGVPSMRSTDTALAALHAVGFTIEHSEDLAERPDDLPWYYPLEGDVRKAQNLRDVFGAARMSWAGLCIAHGVLRVMEGLGVVPRGTWGVAESLKVAADALVKGGKAKLFTPMFLVICRNPAENQTTGLQ